jgi:hypothetical protein
VAWWPERARNPFATAAAVGGAVAAGVFYGPVGNQISDQIGSLADQISEWRDSIGSEHAPEEAGSGEKLTGSRALAGRRSQAEISEEGALNHSRISAMGGKLPLEW